MQHDLSPSKYPPPTGEGVSDDHCFRVSALSGISFDARRDFMITVSAQKVICVLCRANMEQLTVSKLAWYPMTTVSAFLLISFFGLNVSMCFLFSGELIFYVGISVHELC